mgnify:CR=1 FL=1
MLATLALLLQVLLHGGSYRAAMLAAEACNTPTSWAEQLSPGVWVGVCGDDMGQPGNPCEEY